MLLLGKLMDGTEGGTAPKEDAAKERRGPLADVAGASKDEENELNGAREEDDLERLCLSIISVERSDEKLLIYLLTSSFLRGALTKVNLENKPFPSSSASRPLLQR